jgi:hypothetical protein
VRRRVAPDFCDKDQVLVVGVPADDVELTFRELFNGSGGVEQHSRKCISHARTRREVDLHSDASRHVARHYSARATDRQKGWPAGSIITRHRLGTSLSTAPTTTATPMIRRYIIWRNRHALDDELREIVKRANVA